MDHICPHCGRAFAAAPAKPAFRPGREPWGWQVDPNDASRLVTHFEELRAAERIHELRDQGLSYRKIAETLDAEGIAMRGKQWHMEMVRRICSKRRTAA